MRRRALPVHTTHNLEQNNVLARRRLKTVTEYRRLYLLCRPLEREPSNSHEAQSSLREQIKQTVEGIRGRIAKYYHNCGPLAKVREVLEVFLVSKFVCHVDVGLYAHIASTASKATASFGRAKP